MSEIRDSPAVSNTTPPLPNEGSGFPVCGSSEKSRCRLLRKIRIRAPSRQTAVPRSFHPLADKSWPSSYAWPSNRHRSEPVSASTAAMLLYGVVAYSTPSIISGVVSLNPGTVSYCFSGVSQCFHCQAMRSRCTFSGPMSVNGEYFVPP